MEELWERQSTYGRLSEGSRLAWEKLVKRKIYRKNDFFLMEGQIPKTVGFVSEGLLSQYFTSNEGAVIIKRFFPEKFFVASLPALLMKAPSIFAIKALEPCVVWEYSFHDFKQLAEQYPDIMGVYVRYLEQHWVIEKEPMEISFRYDTARTRYVDFLKTYPSLEPRLKQHEIAAYLGVTPTQLSRIRAEL